MNQFYPLPVLIFCLCVGMDQGGKVNLLAKNGDGITPLHDSVMNDHVEVAQLLLQYGGMYAGQYVKPSIC